MITLTDTYEIEKYMRQRLDGNFWAINFEGKVIHCNVPKDFKPTFKRYVAIDNLDEKARAASFRIEWTQEHFRRIEAMRIKGWSWKKVGQHIGGKGHHRYIAQWWRTLRTDDACDFNARVVGHDEVHEYKVVCIGFHFFDGFCAVACFVNACIWQASFDGG